MSIVKPYPKMLLARIADPDTEHEYMAVGTEPKDVEDIHFESEVHPKTARYVLAGVGEIHNTAPRYIEE